MDLVSYFNPLTFDRYDDGLFGIATEEKPNKWRFISIPSKEFNRFIYNDTGIKSFSLAIGSDTCTFSKEIRKSGDRLKTYWYASKKIDGKLKRIYFGNQLFTVEILKTILSKFNDLTQYPGKVTQEKNCVTSPGVLELAGDEKDPNHLQTNLIKETQAMSMAKSAIKELKKENAVLLERVCELNDAYHQRWFEIQKANNERDALAAQIADLNDKHRNYGLAVAIAKERIQELESTVARLEEKLDDAKLKTHEIQQEYDRLLDDRDDQGFMYQQQIDSNYELTVEEQKIKNIITTYRDLAKGKDKRNHPRYAYLIDFLAEIDNLS